MGGRVLLALAAFLPPSTLRPPRGRAKGEGGEWGADGKVGWKGEGECGVICADQRPPPSLLPASFSPIVQLPYSFLRATPAHLHSPPSPIFPATFFEGPSSIDVANVRRNLQVYSCIIAVSSLPSILVYQEDKRVSAWPTHSVHNPDTTFSPNSPYTLLHLPSPSHTQQPPVYLTSLPPKLPPPLPSLRHRAALTPPAARLVQT